MADPVEAVEVIRLVAEADSYNRNDALQDLKFSFGDQWPVEIMNSRTLEARPCLTINETDSYVRQVTNQMRQQRPRIKVHATNNQAQAKIAEVLTGICRHIEVNSDADQAYDTAADFQVRMGWGYWRVLTDYVRENSFDQDIFIAQVQNPFTVYLDPDSILPDGSDSECCVITDMMKKETFKRLYPDQDMAQFNERSSGDQTLEWQNKEDIRLAEYFKIERVKDHLIALSNGTVIWEKDLPEAGILEATGLTVVGDRESYRRKVHWQKQTQTGILEEREWPGRWIPVVPVYGVVQVIDGKRRKFGMVRMGRDPQKMVNFWQTSITESIALAPKAKWLVAEGTDEGHENEYAQANIKSTAVLRFKTTGSDGKEAPPPQRIAPEMPPEGAIQATFMSSQSLQRVLGIFDPAIGKPEQGPKSGTAITAEQRQSEQSNYHFYDNLTRSIKHTGRIILDLVPKVYDERRVMRIIGEDGKPDLVTINDKQIVDGVEKILNDVTVGEYDVVMDTGPGFNTKRLEATNAMSQMLQGNEQLWSVAGDLIFRNMDFPGADIIADRLAAANPLAQIDDKSDIPPKVQMQIKQLQKQLQDTTQQLQAAGMEIKSRQSVQEIKEHGAILREHIKQQGDKEERQVTQAQKQHDTETFALTAQHVAEINALARILTSKTEHAHRMREMIQQFEHESNLQENELKAKSSEKETV